MLGIILTILKILGIVLAVLLGLLLLVVCMVLFVPVRYRFEGAFFEEKRATGKISWFFSVIQVAFRYDEKGFTHCFKLFGTDWFFWKKKKQHKKRSKNISKTEKNRTIKETTEVFGDMGKEVPEQKVEIEEQRIQKKQDKVNDTKKTEKIENFIQKLQEKKEKPEQLFAWKDRLEAFLCEEETIQEQRLLFGILKKIMRHIRPKKCKGWLHFGLEYPNETAWVYAICCTCFDIYGDILELEPDFDREIFEGTLKCKGRICPGFCVYYAIRLYKIKKLREFLQLVKR